jgi:hypothetical protein
LECPSKLVKRCHNQADKGPGKVRKALESLDLPSKLVKRCHNQADKEPGKAGKALERWKG